MTLGPKSWIIFTVSDFSNWTLAWGQFIPAPMHSLILVSLILLHSGLQNPPTMSWWFR